MDTEIYIEDARRVTAAVSASVDVVQIVGTVIWEAASTEVELGLALLVNDDERIAMLGAEHQAIIDIAAEVIDEIWREIDALDDYEKGRLMGLVAGTIAIEFVTVAASAGTGAVLKSTVLARALPKLRARPPVQRHNDVVAAIDRVTGLVADIATTRMCFARGTLVHSSDGLRPIEEIRRGDAVLSRDPGTGRTGWKPVRNVFATSPDALLRLSVSKQAATGRAQRERVLSAQASQEARTDREPAPRVRTTAPDATEDILSTHSHPFCSVSRDDFVLAGEVRIGEELFLAGASTAFVTDIQVERGPPSNGGPWTTHNLEVDDWHTYFVGELGVRLHNEGPACQRAFSIIRCLRDRQGGTSWDALRSVLNDTPRPALLPKIRPILPQVAREMTIETLREAVLPNGTVDLGRVPTFRQIKNYRGTMAGMSLKTRVTGLENHHLVPKEVARLLGLSTSGLDDSPACLLPRTELRKGNGEGAESFHAVLRGRIAMLGLEPSNERVIAALLLSHTEIGIADARPVVEAWLRGDGVWQE